jgi:c(7)-type cytochrome triheme protein
MPGLTGEDATMNSAEMITGDGGGMREDPSTVTDTDSTTFKKKGGETMRSKVLLLTQKGGEKKGKIIAMAIVLLVSIAFAGTALAVPSGKTLEFPGAMGKVVFDGKIHADKGFKCGDCHTKIFPMKRTTLTMAEINAGKECGACHNGEKAFKASDPANCTKCHKK